MQNHTSNLLSSAGLISNIILLTLLVSWEIFSQDPHFWVYLTSEFSTYFIFFITSTKIESMAMDYQPEFIYFLFLTNENELLP